MPDPIYLDYNATSPMAPEVVEAMSAALSELWGNPSSDHPYGHRARKAVGTARDSVAGLIGCRADEVVFTGGGTESDNAALLGIAAAASRGRHLITSAIEHPAVENTCLQLESQGWEVTRLGVDSHGRVSAEEAGAAFRDETSLVSIMHANNETGVMQPIAEIGAAARSAGIAMHTDAAQSVGKLPCSVDELNVDSLTIAGHKLYGPKGVGVLYLRRGTHFARHLHGAGHEGGRRAGTENVPGIVGLGVACDLARRELTQRVQRIGDLRDRLESTLCTAIPDAVVHGREVERLPNTLYIALPGATAAELVATTPGVAMAAGSACDAGRTHLSATLRAMRVPAKLALCTLRLTLGRSTTLEEIERGAAMIVASAETLRRRGHR